MNNFADRHEMLKRLGFFATPAQVEVAATPQRGLLVTTRTMVRDRARGARASVVELIRKAQRTFSGSVQGECVEVNPFTGRPSSSREAYAAADGDQVVWNGLQVVALLRPRPDGTLEVLRIGSSRMAG